MINSSSMQSIFPLRKNHILLKIPKSKSKIGYNPSFKTLHNIYRQNISNNKSFYNNRVLTDLNFSGDKTGIQQFTEKSNHLHIYNSPSLLNMQKNIFSKKGENVKRNIFPQLNNLENINTINLNKTGINCTNNEVNLTRRIVNINKYNSNSRIQTGKIPHPVYLLKNLSPQKQINNNIINYNKINTNYITNINTNINNIITQEEPKNDFNLNEFIIIKTMGKGAEGIIYAVKWTKNNKQYALKKTKIMIANNIIKRKKDNETLKNFIESTGCDGIIKTYATLCRPNNMGFTDCFEIMELAEKDWETEILNRGKEKRFYSEFELSGIFRNLIKIFALLQKHHITHRDIKPQNIMLINNKMKICDFGNSRVLKRKGYIIQRIRGSELFMSPIVFKGYRSGLQNIGHNAYKSDVYSLGICFFLAASLSYDGPNFIRPMNDMNKIKNVLDYNLANKYSAKIINLIYTMIQIEEKVRPDFLELEAMLQ